MIKSYLMPNNLDYDGSQLKHLWIYENTGLAGDAIVAFLGKADVCKHLVDMADVLAKDFIYSEIMLHFLIEHFSLDLEKTILRQRLLMVIIKESLEELCLQKSLSIIRKGDDIFINDKKLSVSIATVSIVSGLIHIGLNLSNKNTPLPTFGLWDLFLDTEIKDFAQLIQKKYIAELTEIEFAKCKVKTV